MTNNKHDNQLLVGFMPMNDFWPMMGDRMLAVMLKVYW